MSTPFIPIGTGTIQSAFPPSAGARGYPQESGFPEPRAVAVAAASPIATGAGAPAQGTVENAVQALAPDPAISMPATPLADFLTQLRATVNAQRLSEQRAKTPSGARHPAPGRQVTTPALRRAAAKAYSDVQQLTDKRQPARSVDIYHGER